MEKEIQEIIDNLISNSIINIEDIPNIDLYVDQVTSFIEQNLESFGTEKSITKSMVNNYCKNGVIPSPIKKKYNKNHIIMLILIYNTKSILQINDLKKIFSSISDDDLVQYYNYVNTYIDSFNQSFKDDTINAYKIMPLDDDKQAIRIHATKLSIEANYKKQLAELLIEKYL